MICSDTLYRYFVGIGGGFWSMASDCLSVIDEFNVHDLLTELVFYQCRQI